MVINRQKLAFQLVFVLLELLLCVFCCKIKIYDNLYKSEGKTKVMDSIKKSL